MSAATIVQPPPTEGTVAVWPAAISYAENQNYPPGMIADMRQRDAFGRAKYGTTLMTENGRDPIVDGYQECLDLCVYMTQAVLERPDDSLVSDARARAFSMTLLLHVMLNPEVP